MSSINQFDDVIVRNSTIVAGLNVSTNIQSNINRIGVLETTKWNTPNNAAQLLNINQNLSSTSSPTFAAVTSASSYLISAADTANPTYSTRSVGSKVILQSALSSSACDYALGVGANQDLWYSVPSSSSSFSWYSGINKIVTVSGTGVLSASSAINTPLQTFTYANNSVDNTYFLDSGQANAWSFNGKSDFVISRYNGGAAISALAVSRTTGNVSINGSITSNGVSVTSGPSSFYNIRGATQTTTANDTLFLGSTGTASFYMDTLSSTLVLGYNTTKVAASTPRLQVYNNASDAVKLLEVTSRGTTAGTANLVSVGCDLNVTGGNVISANSFIGGSSGFTLYPNGTASGLSVSASGIVSCTNTSDSDATLLTGSAVFNGGISVTKAINIGTTLQLPVAATGDKILLTNAAAGSKISHSAPYTIQMNAGTGTQSHGAVALNVSTTNGYTPILKARVGGVDVTGVMNVSGSISSTGLSVLSQSMDLVGPSTSTYISFYPKGYAAARKAYFGYISGDDLELNTTEGTGNLKITSNLNVSANTRIGLNVNALAATSLLEVGTTATYSSSQAATGLRISNTGNASSNVSSTSASSYIFADIQLLSDINGTFSGALATGNGSASSTSTCLTWNAGSVVITPSTIIGSTQSATTGHVIQTNFAGNALKLQNYASNGNSSLNLTNDTNTVNSVFGLGNTGNSTLAGKVYLSGNATEFNVSMPINCTTNLSVGGTVILPLIVNGASSGGILSQFRNASGVEKITLVDEDSLAPRVSSNTSTAGLGLAGKAGSLHFYQGSSNTEVAYMNTTEMRLNVPLNSVSRINVTNPTTSNISIASLLAPSLASLATASLYLGSSLATDSSGFITFVNNSTSSALSLGLYGSANTLLLSKTAITASGNFAVTGSMSMQDLTATTITASSTITSSTTAAASGTSYNRLILSRGNSGMVFEGGLTQTVGPAMRISSTTDGGTTLVPIIQLDGSTLSITKSLTSTSPFSFAGTLNNGFVGNIRNSSNGTAAYTSLLLSNDVGNASLFFNSSTRTNDGGVNGLTLRNDNGNLYLQASGGKGLTLSLTTGNAAFDNTVNVNSTLDSSSSTGALRVEGGISVAKSGYFTSGVTVGTTLLFPQSTVADPTTNTRSSGARLIVAPSLSATSADFALGVGTSKFWFGVPDSSSIFAWFAGSSSLATLSGTGVLSTSGSIVSQGNFVATGSFVGSSTGFSITPNGVSVGVTVFGAGTVALTNTLDATATNNAATTIYGGLGVAKSMYIGGSLTGASATFSSLGITGATTLTSGTITGSPATANDITNKTYVDGAVNLKWNTPANAANLLLIDQSLATTAAPTFAGLTSTAPINGTHMNQTILQLGNTTQTWYKIASLPASAGGTFDHIHLLVNLRTAASSATSTMLDLEFGNRNQFYYQYTSKGQTVGSPASVVVYNNAAGAADIYIQLGINNFTFATYSVIDQFQAVISTPYTSSTTAPSGTLIFDASNQTLYPPLLTQDAASNRILQVSDSSSVTTGALQVRGGVGVAKSAYIGANLNVLGSTTLSTLTVSADSTLGQHVIGSNRIELGINQTSSSPSYIDFHATVGSDFETRVVREVGANGIFHIQHTGTGEVRITAPTTILNSGLTVLGGTALGGTTIGGSLNVSGPTISSGLINITNTTTLGTSSNTLSSTSGALTVNGDVQLYNATKNTLIFNSVGVASPTFTNRTAGAKIIFYPAISSTAVDWAMGMENNGLWSSVQDSNGIFRWYGGTTSMMTLTNSTLAVSMITLNTGTVSGTPTNANDIANKAYVDSVNVVAGTGLTKSGTTLSVNASQTQITAVGTLSSLNVTGTATLSSLITNTTSIGGHMTPTQDAQFNLGSGTFRLGSLYTANAIISGGLTVTGSSSLATLSASGTSTLTSVNISGTTSSSGVVNITNTTALGTSSNTLSSSSGALTVNGDLHLYNGTKNTLIFNSFGVASPTFTNRTAGTKIIFYPAISSTAVDWAMGMENNALWSSVQDTNGIFRWYGGTASMMTLTNSTLAVSTITLNTGTISGTPTNANDIVNKAYVDNNSGSVVAGTGLTKTGSTLSVNASQTQITAIGTLSSLNVTGTATLSSLITNTTSIGGHMTPTQDAQFNLGSGTFRLGSLYTANAIISGGLTVTGSSSLATLSASGTSTLTSVNISGTTISSGLINITNTTTLGTSSNTLSSTSGALTVNGDVQLYNATKNTLIFNSVGVASPTFTNRAAGTKIVFYPSISATTVDWAMGMEGNSLWSSVTNTGGMFRWYGGTTSMMTLTNSTLAVASANFTNATVSGTPTNATDITSKTYVDGVYVAGTGLTKTGTTFSVNASQTQITSIGTLSSLAIVTSGSTSMTPLTVYQPSLQGGSQVVSLLGISATTGNSAYVNYTNSATNAGTYNFGVYGGVNVGVSLTGLSTSGNLNVTGSTTLSSLTTNTTSIGGHMTPTLDSQYNLGSGSFRMGSVYSVNVIATNLTYSGSLGMSDRRLKKNIKTTPIGLDFVCNLKPVMYEWKDPNICQSKKQFGLIAQDVKELLDDLNIPECGMVCANEEGMYSIAHLNLLAPMIAAIKELREEVRMLKQDMSQL